MHLFRLQPATPDRSREAVQIATSADRQDGKPVFRAPTLPTANQFNNELPFRVNHGPRLRRRS